MHWWFDFSTQRWHGPESISTLVIEDITPVPRKLVSQPAGQFSLGAARAYHMFAVTDKNELMHWYFPAAGGQSHSEGGIAGPEVFDQGLWAPFQPTVKINIFGHNRIIDIFGLGTNEKIIMHRFIDVPPSGEFIWSSEQTPKLLGIQFI